MRLIRGLLREQYKNFRILLRNLSSLLLLVIGPLALILLVGYAYSGTTFHDVNLGVTSSNYSALEPAFQNFSSFANIRHYNDTDSCVSDLMLYKTEVCMKFSDDFGKLDPASPGLISGTITFYYDNSRKPLSEKLVNVLTDFFGLEAEKISIESAKTIFTDIQDFVDYVESKNQDLIVMVNESQNIKQSLVERHDRLVAMREEFMPIYNNIKVIQQRLDNVSGKMDSTYTRYNESYSELHRGLQELKGKIRAANRLLPAAELYIYESAEGFRATDNLSFVLKNNLTYYNLSDYEYSLDLEDMLLNVSGLNESLLYSYPMLVNISNLDKQVSLRLATDASLEAIEAFEAELGNFSGTTDEYYNYLNYQRKQLDAAVSLIDDVKLMLDADIEMTEEYIEKIDLAVVKVKATQEELNSTIKVFSRFSPDQAEKLVSPFIQEYKPLLPKISNITQAYPGMLAIIIIFISILFANIVALSEINSKAFYRNLLAPVDKLVYIFGLMISIIVIVLFQALVLLLVGQFSFGIDVFGVIAPVLLVACLLSLLFIALGMIIAVLIRSEQSSVLTTTFVALGFFLFSDSVTPVQIMPKLAGMLASQNPYLIATFAFKKIVVFRLGLMSCATELLTLGLYLAVALAVLVVVSKRRLKN